MDASYNERRQARGYGTDNNRLRQSDASLVLLSVNRAIMCQSATDGVAQLRSLNLGVHPRIEEATLTPVDAEDGGGHVHGAQAEGRSLTEHTRAQDRPFRK